MPTSYTLPRLSSPTTFTRHGLLACESSLFAFSWSCPETRSPLHPPTDRPRRGLQFTLVRLLLPATGTVALLRRAGQDATPATDGPQLSLLRLGQPAVRRTDGFLDSGRLRLWPGDRSRTDRQGRQGRRKAAPQPTAEDSPGHLNSHQPLAAGLLQVLQLRRGQLQRPGHRSGCCGLAMGHLFPDHVATGNQFLHFPVDELHDRRLPGPGGRHRQPGRLRVLRLDVSPTGRRADHPVPRGGPAARTANPHARKVRSRNGTVHPRTVQEGPAGQFVRPAGRPGL